MDITGIDIAAVATMVGSIGTGEGNTHFVRLESEAKETNGLLLAVGDAGGSP